MHYATLTKRIGLLTTALLVTGCAGEDTRYEVEVEPPACTRPHPDGTCRQYMEP